MTLAQILRERRNEYLIVCFTIVLLFLPACGGNLPPTTISPETSEENIASLEPTPEKASNGYPIPSGYPDQGDDPSGYPTPNIYENLSNEPPNPDVNLPPSNNDNAVIGGVLVRQVVGEGYEPLVPLSLSLADIVLSTEGKPAFISAGEESLKAELFPTGIFIFQNVSPGTYGFMVDVGYTQFFIKDDEDTPMLVEVQPGDVVDLGQIFTELP